MLWRIVKRVLGIIPLVLIMIFVLYTVLLLGTPDPAPRILGPWASPEQQMAWREQQGLNDPLHIQLFNYIYNVIHGDFGRSWTYNERVTDLVMKAFPVTVELTVAGMIVAIIIGIPAGMIAAIKRGNIHDDILRLVALIGASMPVFWSGVLFILIFSLWLRLLPSQGIGTPQHLILPAIVIGLWTAGSLARVTRSSVLNELNKDYVRTARAKGLSERVILVKHVLRNSLVPILTVASLQFGMLLSGAVVTETVFSLPGIGRLMVTSILNGDYPVVLASAILICVMFVIVNLVTDILYTYINPKIRY